MYYWINRDDSNIKKKHIRIEKKTDCSANKLTYEYEVINSVSNHNSSVIN